MGAAGISSGGVYNVVQGKLVLCGKYVIIIPIINIHWFDVMATRRILQHTR